MAETAKKISMIPAKVQYDRNVKLSEKKMKVAAYCRVSTELEEQDSSYEAQLEYYTSKISENENWKNAGIYADDGKSGTNTKKRADFNAMIQDALCEFPYKSRVMGTSEPLKPLKAPYMARNPVKWGFFRLKGQEIPLKI